MERTSEFQKCRPAISYQKTAPFVQIGIDGRHQILFPPITRDAPDPAAMSPRVDLDPRGSSSSKPKKTLARFGN
jgi:hypothetical protein